MALAPLLRAATRGPRFCHGKPPTLAGGPWPSGPPARRRGGPLAGASPPRPPERAQRRKPAGAHVAPARDLAHLPLQCVAQLPWRSARRRPRGAGAAGPPTQRAAETHPHPDTVRPCLRRCRQEGRLGLLPPASAVAPRPRARRGPEAVPPAMARLTALDNALPDRALGRRIFSVRRAPASQDRPAALAPEPAGPPSSMGVGDSHRQGDRSQARGQSSNSRLRAGPSAGSGAAAPSPARPSIGGGPAVTRRTARGWGPRAWPQGSRPDRRGALMLEASPPPAPSGCGGGAPRVCSAPRRWPCAPWGASRPMLAGGGGPHGSQGGVEGPLLPPVGARASPGVHLRQRGRLHLQRV